MLMTFIKPHDLVVDVGAHLGTFAVPIARMLSPRGRVIAFEADADNFAVLQKTVDQNGLQAQIELCCNIVTDQSGAYRYVPREGNTGAGEYFPAEAGIADVLTHTIRLDDWNGAEGPLDRLDVLKIDAEGMELAVLKSAAGLISRFRPVIYAEVNIEALTRQGVTPADIQAFLQPFGYRFFRNVGERNSSNDVFSMAELTELTLRPVMYDILCLRAEDVPDPLPGAA